MLLIILFQFVLYILDPVDCFTATPVSRPRPQCQLPAPRLLPKLTDCLHVIRDIRMQADRLQHRLLTISRREGSNIHVPNTWWDHVPHSTCAIQLDMVDRYPDGSDTLRLDDVLRTAEEIVEECLTPRPIERWGGSEGVSR